MRSAGTQEIYLLDRAHALRLNTTDAATAAADRFDDVPTAFAQRRLITSAGTSDGDEVVRVAMPVTIDGERYVLAARKPISEVRDAVAVVRRAFLTAALSGLVIALLLGLGFAATLVRRLRRLRDATVRLAEHGPVEEVPADRNRDEVGDLTRAFARMQQRLHQQEEARRAFVSTASHELRTPVASLRGMLELLADELAHGEVTSEQAREQVTKALVQARRLGRLAADLLDLSRIDAEVALRSEPVELRELSRAVIAEFELGAPRPPRAAPCRGLDDGDEEVRVRADPGAIAQILRILFDNAVRASPPGEPVTVRVQPGRGRCPCVAVGRRRRPGRAGGGARARLPALRPRQRLQRRRLRPRAGDRARTGRADGRLAGAGAERPPGATFTLRLPPSEDHYPS